MFKKRALTGAVILAMTIGFFALKMFVSAYFFDVYIGAIAIFSIYEVCNLFDKSQKKNDKYVILAYPVLCYFALLMSVLNNWSILIFLAIILVCAVLLFFACFLLNKFSKARINREMVECGAKVTYNKYVQTKTFRDLFLIFFPAILVVSMFVINHLPSFVSKISVENAGLLSNFLIVGLLVTTMMTDTCAFLVGSGIGGKKLCPKISPNKTIVGAIGGLVGGILASMMLFYIFAVFAEYRTIFLSANISIWTCLVYGLIASILTQFGDIFASYIKRKNNAKDYGNILPGHGGVMDRVDGLIFNAFLLAILSLILF